MTIWIIDTDIEGHQYLVLAHPTRDAKIMRNFRGEPFADSWIPLHVKVVPDGPNLGDFPHLSSGMLVCSERALQVISPLVEISVEVLPLRCDSCDFHAINVVDVFDCLDYSRSEFERFQSGHISRITRHVFKPGCLNGKHIFKIPERRGGPIFVSDAFKELVEANQLEGLKFFEVWEG